MSHLVTHAPFVPVSSRTKAPAPGLRDAEVNRFEVRLVAPPSLRRRSVRPPRCDPRVERSSAFFLVGGGRWAAVGPLSRSPWRRRQSGCRGGRGRSKGSFEALSWCICASRPSAVFVPVLAILFRPASMTGLSSCPSNCSHVIWPELSGVKMPGGEAKKVRSRGVST